MTAPMMSFCKSPQRLLFACHPLGLKNWSSIHSTAMLGGQEQVCRCSGSLGLSTDDAVTVDCTTRLGFVCNAASPAVYRAQPVAKSTRYAYSTSVPQGTAAKADQ
jgi:hypothetical protein